MNIILKLNKIVNYIWICIPQKLTCSSWTSFIYCINTNSTYLEERLPQFLGAVMVTVGKGLVGVETEPP